MKKFDVSPSKIMLILLGVLVAIIVGFSSNAIGAKNSFVDLNAASSKIESVQKHISSLDPQKKVADFLLQLVK